VACYLEEFGMMRRDVSRESYWHYQVPLASTRERLTLDQETFNNSVCAQLADTCKRLLSVNRRENFAKKPTLMQRALTAMFTGDETEVVPARPDLYRFKFLNARVVRTFAELRHETLLLLEAPWQLLLCVAESGEWLLADEVMHIIKMRQGPVGVIVADTVVQDKLSAVPNIRVQNLPWHLHNRHMTVRLVEADGKLIPDRAIYFERRHRSQMISPVVLTQEAELGWVLDDFTVYWLKAQQHKKGLSEVITYSPDRLNQEQQSILQELSAMGKRGTGRPKPLIAAAE
jgi:hypothetical protein